MADPNETEGRSAAPGTDRAPDLDPNWRERDPDQVRSTPSDVPAPGPKKYIPLWVLALIIATGPLAVFTLGRGTLDDSPGPPLAVSPEVAAGQAGEALPGSLPGGVPDEFRQSKTGEPVPPEALPTPPPPPATVADLAAQRGELRMFEQAVAQSGLGALKGEGPFTVLAPDNAAFERMLNRAGGQGLEGRDALRRLVERHVIAGRYGAEDLARAGEVETLAGQTLPVYIAPRLTVANAHIVGGDLQASNGIVHIVDTVMR